MHDGREGVDCAIGRSEGEGWIVRVDKCAWLDAS